MIHLYRDAALSQPISEGDLSSPDSDAYNGTDGESKDAQIWVGNEQAELAGPLAFAGITVSLVEPGFQDGQDLIVDQEQMRVLSGGGTTTLTVQRGYNGTNQTGHSTGAVVYTAYRYTGLAVDPVDANGSDESPWYTLALTEADLDTAAPGAALALGTKAHDGTLSFWRRCTVPAGTPVQNKTDIKLQLTGWIRPLA